MVTGGTPLVRTSRLLHRCRDAGPLSSLVPGSTPTINLWTEGEKRGSKWNFFFPYNLSKWMMNYSKMSGSIKTDQQGISHTCTHTHTWTHTCAGQHVCSANDDEAVLQAPLISGNLSFLGLSGWHFFISTLRLTVSPSPPSKPNTAYVLRHCVHTRTNQSATAVSWLTGEKKWMIIEQNLLLCNILLEFWGFLGGATWHNHTCKSSAPLCHLVHQQDHMRELLRNSPRKVTRSSKCPHSFELPSCCQIQIWLSSEEHSLKKK